MKQPTSNIQHPTPNPKTSVRQPLDVGCWMLVVGCFLLASNTRAASLTTVAGNGTKGFDGDGGPATAAKLADPGGICTGPDGALYICDTANHRIRKVASDGKISTLA